MENFNNYNPDSFPFRAPTMVKIDNRILLVMSKTTEKNKPTSLCFVEVISDIESFLEITREKDTFTRLSSNILPRIRAECYEIPGAEAFLGIDEDAEHVYYLTNKMYCDPDSDPCSSAEAHFSSPPLVRKISLKAMQEIYSLMHGGANPDKDPFSGSQGGEEDPQSKINKIMSEVETWKVLGD